MDEKEKMVRHLEMIQGVINRLGNNSFLIKSWSMTVVIATIVLVARFGDINPFFSLSLIIPVFGFWILDGYFIYQENLFCEVYNEIRKQEDTDFAMNISKHKNKPKCNWRASIFSTTLIFFYFTEIFFIMFIFTILKCSNSLIL